MVHCVRLSKVSLERSDSQGKRAGSVQRPNKNKRKSRSILRCHHPSVSTRLLSLIHLGLNEDSAAVHHVLHYEILIIFLGTTLEKQKHPSIK